MGTIKRNIKNNNGYTLMEIIIVVGLVGLALTTFYSIIFSILRQQLQVYTLQQVKRQGDNIIQSITQTIRNNGVKIYSESLLTNEKCKNSGISYIPANDQEFIVMDKIGKYFFYYLDGENIASGPAALHINSSDVIITDFSISCLKSANYSTPVIKVALTVNKSGTALRYQTRVKLRSY